MRQYIINKKAEIKEVKVKERDIDFIKTKAMAQAVIGPRRAGKSFSLFYWIKKLKLKDEDYLFVNFEDDEVVGMSREKKTRAVEYHVKVYNKEPNFIFLDEIQELERWESFLYSLIEKKKYTIFFTGSNSKLLSKEIATQLRGRAITRVVFPFSFKEFIKLEGFKLSKYPTSIELAKLIHLLDKFINFTGFPNVLIDKINPKLFFKDYLDLIIFKDLVERYGIENVHVLKLFILRAISNFAREFSINKIYNEFSSLGIKIAKGTLYNYASYLEDVMTLFLVKRFYPSERKSQLSIPKVYLCDNGLANFIISSKTEKDSGWLIENLVAIELKKRELKKEFNVFYWKDETGKEVDFVIKEDLSVKQLIQVSYASARDEVDKREIKALLKASELLRCKDLLVITWDYEAEEEIKGRQIKFIPLWKWLLTT